MAETGLPIEQILVTTYTELATAELRDRIRKILQRALEASQNRDTTDDLICEIVRRVKDPAQLRHRLENALRNFDEAPIFTIHGFCARALAEKAFETGTFFDAEFSADQSQILAAVADDFWRRNIFTSGQITAAIARDKIQPKTLVNLLNELTNNPRIRVLPATTEAELKEIEQQIAKAWKQLCADWNASRQEMIALFQNTGWAKGSHAKREVVERSSQLVPNASDGCAVGPNFSLASIFFLPKRSRQIPGLERRYQRTDSFEPVRVSSSSPMAMQRRCNPISAPGHAKNCNGAKPIAGPNRSMTY